MGPTNFLEALKLKLIKSVISVFLTINVLFGISIYFDLKHNISYL